MFMHQTAQKAKYVKTEAERTEKSNRLSQKKTLPSLFQ